MKKQNLTKKISVKFQKITLLLLMSLFWHQTLPAQQSFEIQNDTTWVSTVQNIFAGIDKTKVPHGILLDYAMEFTHLPAYNGVLNDSVFVDANVFSNIYRTLLMGMVQNDTLHLPLYNQVAYRWAHNRAVYNQAEKGTVVLSGLYYKYARFAQDAVAQNKLTVSNNRFYDKYINGQWQNPYETLQVIAYAPPVTRMDKFQFGVILPDEQILSNSEADIQSIEVDFGDGKGYQDLTSESKVYTGYSQNGAYTWTFKTTLTNGDVLYSKSSIIIDVPDYQIDSNTASGGDGNNIFIPGPMHMINGALLGGAILRIDYAAGRKQIEKPLIVVEGFDPGSVTHPEIEGGDSTIGDFMYDIAYDSGRLYNKLYNNSTQEYDIIYVDWGNGTADIRENAETLENVINWVNAHKLANGSTEPNVVLGQSMGGVVSRYCLASMEQEGKNHDVRLFVAHDSPMQGANIPLGFQAAAVHMQHIYTSSPLLWTMGEIIIPIISLNGMLFDFSSPGEAFYITECPAYKQMSYYYMQYLGVPVNAALLNTSFHHTWQTELESIGYPAQCRNIAISNGNECAPDQGFGPHATLFDFHATTENGISVTTGNSTLFFDDFFTGLIFSNPLLMVAGMIPGSSTYDFDFVVHANPDVDELNDREVYFGRIHFKKVYAYGLFSVSFDLTRASINAPATDDFLPYSVYTGGYYNMSTAIDSISIGNSSISDAIMYERFGFIPTVSALDIKRDNHKVEPADYQKQYAGGQTPEPELSTSFENFIVEYDNTSVQVNHKHISFQTRNGNWLADELDEQPSICDCEDMCTDEQYVTGSPIICDSETYYISNTIADTDPINWQIYSGNYLVTMTTNVDTATLTANNPDVPGGFVTLAAYFENCSYAIGAKQIWVGLPDVDLNINYNNNLSASLAIVSNNGLLADQGVTDISWTLEGSFGATFYPGDINNDAFVWFTTEYSWIKGYVTVTNDCGSVSYNFIATGASDIVDCSNNDNSDDLIIIKTGTNEYKVANVCSGDFEAINASELYDLTGYKVDDLFPVGDKVEVDDNQSQQVRIISIETDKGIKTKVILIQ